MYSEEKQVLGTQEGSRQVNAPTAGHSRRVRDAGQTGTGSRYQGLTTALMLGTMFFRKYSFRALQITSVKKYEKL